MENESIQHIQEYLSIKTPRQDDTYITKNRKKEIKRSNIWELSGPSLDFYTFAAFAID